LAVIQRRLARCGLTKVPGPSPMACIHLERDRRGMPGRYARSSASKSVRLITDGAEATGGHGAGKHGASRGVGTDARPQRREIFLLSGLRALCVKALLTWSWTGADRTITTFCPPEPGCGLTTPLILILHRKYQRKHHRLPVTIQQ